MSSYGKIRHENIILKNSQYWDTVELRDGGIIWVIKSKRKKYLKGDRE